MKNNIKGITLPLLSAFCFFGTNQTRGGNLNEIINQIISDLDKKKEAVSTNAPASQTTKQPAKEEQRKPAESQ